MKRSSRSQDELNGHTDNTAGGDHALAEQEQEEKESTKEGRRGDESHARSNGLSRSPLPVFSGPTTPLWPSASSSKRLSQSHMSVTSNLHHNHQPTFTNANNSTQSDINNQHAAGTSSRSHDDPPPAVSHSGSASAPRPSLDSSNTTSAALIPIPVSSLELIVYNHQHQNPPTQQQQHDDVLPSPVPPSPSPRRRGRKVVAATDTDTTQQQNSKDGDHDHAHPESRIKNSAAATTAVSNNNINTVHHQVELLTAVDDRVEEGGITSTSLRRQQTVEKEEHGEAGGVGAVVESAAVRRRSDDHPLHNYDTQNNNSNSDGGIGGELIAPPQIDDGGGPPRIKYRKGSEGGGGGAGRLSTVTVGAAVDELELVTTQMCPLCRRPFYSRYRFGEDDDDDMMDDADGAAAAIGHHHHQAGARGGRGGGDGEGAAGSSSVRFEEYFRTLAAPDGSVHDLDDMHSEIAESIDIGSVSQTQTPGNGGGNNGGPTPVVELPESQSPERNDGGESTRTGDERSTSNTGTGGGSGLGGFAGSEDFDSLGASPTMGGTKTFDPKHTYYGRYFVELGKAGQGAYGGVFVARHVMQGESLGIFAVKKIPIGAERGGLFARRALAEVKTLEMLRHHPNLIEYHHSWLDFAHPCDFGPPVRCLFILMEYATHGTLEGLCKRSSHRLSNDVVWWFTFQLLAALRHCHDRGYLHRDVKPDNLLLSLSPQDMDAPLQLKLSDFGIAAPIPNAGLTFADEEQAAKTRTGGTGTRGFMAPELFQYSVKDSDVAPTYSRLHTTASDLWGVGCVLHYMAFGGKLPRVPSDVGMSSPPPTPSDQSHHSDTTATTAATTQRNSNLPRFAHLRSDQMPDGIVRPTPMIELCRALLAIDPRHRIDRCGTILDQPIVKALYARLSRMSWSDMVKDSPGSTPKNTMNGSAAAGGDMSTDVLSLWQIEGPTSYPAALPPPPLLGLPPPPPSSHAEHSSNNLKQLPAPPSASAAAADTRTRGLYTHHEQQQSRPRPQSDRLRSAHTPERIENDPTSRMHHNDTHRGRECLDVGQDNSEVEVEEDEDDEDTSCRWQDGRAIRALQHLPSVQQNDDESNSTTLELASSLRELVQHCRNNGLSVDTKFDALLSRF